MNSMTTLVKVYEDAKDTHLPAVIIDKPVVTGRQVQFANETLRHWKLLQLAKQQLPIELVKLLTPVGVYHCGDGPWNGKDDGRLYNSLSMLYERHF